MKLENPELYVCILKEEEPLEWCRSCTGITNDCGLYKNKLNKSPFKELYCKRREDKTDYKN